MNTDTTSLINSLLRGVNFSNKETIRDAWRALLERGSVSVPAVEKKLRASTWKKVPRGPVIEYFTVLLSLLGALDPASQKREIQRLRAGKLHPVYSKILDGFSSRVGDRPVTHIGPDIPVYIAPEIEDLDLVAGNLKTWSRTSELELEGVTRIDVIASRPEQDYRGQYRLYFSGIRLTWPAKKVRRRNLWWKTLRAEHTFYHEVGHHACGHIEGGQVEEQEKEANRYAKRMLRRSRPVISRVLRLLHFLLRPLLRWLAKSPKA